MAPRIPRSIIVYALLWGGLAVGRELPGAGSVVGFAAACALCVVAGLVRGRTCRLALAGAAVCFGAGWFTLRILEPPGDALDARLAGTPSATAHVRGVVLNTPRPSETERDPLTLPFRAEEGLRFDLRVSSLEDGDQRIRARGVVSVFLSGAQEPRFTAGDTISITGIFEPIAGPLNPGEMDRRPLARQEGRVGRVRVTGPDLVARDEAVGLGVSGFFLRLRAALSDRAHAILLGDAESGGGPGRAFLAALILGESEAGLSDIRSAFARLGIAHLLAISGFHIVVMVGVVLLALRTLGDLGRWEPILTAAIVLLYLAILPFQAPVWRAALLVLGLLAGDALGRRHNRLSTLGWIAVALILWRPLDAWSLGFQLSFGLVALLLWLGEPTQLRLFIPGLQGTLKRPSPLRPAGDMLKGLVSSGLLCWLTSVPIVLYRTGLFTPLAVPAGIILLPPIVALMAAAYTTLALGVLVPSAAPAMSSALGHLAAWTASLIQWLDGIPYASFYAPPVPLLWCVAATALLVFWFARGRLRSRRLWVLAGALIAWIAAESWLMHPAAPLRIDTLAVGDGTCHIIRTGRASVLWDCGSMRPGIGRSLVPRAARALGVWRTPIAVISHPNLDHFNGLLDAAEPLGVRTVLIGEAFQRSAARPASPEAYVLDQFRTRGIEVRIITAGDTLALGDSTLEFLSPPRGAAWPEANDLSLVGRISVAGRTLMLTGDIQDRGMAGVLASSPQPRADILEAPHHGSARPAAAAFIASLNPSVVLQSTGPRRAGDPRLAPARAGRQWRTTAIDGASWAEVAHDGSIRSGSCVMGE